MSRFLGGFMGLAAILSVSAWAQSAQQTSPLPLAKLDKLAQWETHRAQAVSHANLNAAPDRLDELAHVFSGHPRVWLGEDFHGDWRCRMVRLSPRVPVEIREWTDCNLYESAGALRIDASRVQRTFKGRFVPLNDRQWWFVNEQGRHMGIAVSHQENRLRIEIPEPRSGVTYDVLELRRR